MTLEVETLPQDTLLDLAASGKLTLFQLIAASESRIASNNRLEAIDLYRAWLKKPDSAVAYAAYFNMAVLLSDTGSQSEAEAAYRQAVYLKNDFPQAQYNLGVQLEKQGRFHDAIAQWKGALSLESLQTPAQNETHKLFLNSLGRLHDKYYQYEDAEEMLRQSLALDANQRDASTIGCICGKSNASGRSCVNYPTFPRRECGTPFRPWRSWG
jgi:tetratricopeptide (TPR) repeat protein